jgi:hypothetical protein
MNEKTFTPEECALAAGFVKTGEGAYSRPELLAEIEKFGQPYCHATCGFRWRSKTPVNFCPGCGVPFGAAT